MPTHCGRQTSTVLASFFLAMTLHPDVVKRAQDEIDHVVGNARLPDLDDRGSLPYVESVLTEVYRCAIPSHTRVLTERLARWNPPLYLGMFVFCLSIHSQSISG